MARQPIGAGDVAVVTGGSSGIGAGLAAAMHARGATVVVAGRDQDRLRAVAERHPGMETALVDVADPASIRDFAAEVTARHPAPTVLVNNAGVQRVLDFSAAQPPGPEEVAVEVDANFSGLVNVTSAFLPALRRAQRARLVHVGSGLAFVPRTSVPVYSATKAAVHSFTVSLRRQLAGSQVQVVELIPPVVETRLHRDLAATPPRAMPLGDFVAAAMKGLDSGADEVAVGLARVLTIGSRLAPGRFLALVNRE